MSYQSIKRVLGEPSLELKCLLLFGICLLVLLATSFWWYGSKTEELVYREARKTGRLLVDQIMYIRHWEALETNEKFKPLVQDLTAKLSKQEYEWRFIRPFESEGPAAPRDQFERNLVERFVKSEPEQPSDPDKWERAERPPGGNQYVYYQPVRAEEESCVLCHRALAPGGSGFSGTPLAAGDVMAVVQVSIPNRPTQLAQSRNRAIMLAVAIVTVFLAMMASYLIVRYVIVKPLRHLRDVSDEISHGNISLRADIHTGDEFEDLAVAFNRMLRHLINAQEELRQVNASLDGKVDELAQVNMRLYEMNAVKSDFLATMSHELRTPLNSILGFSDVLGSIASLNEKQRRYVGNIQQSGKMLLEMINAILDLAKVESGKTDIRLTDFTIGQVVHAQCDMARPLTEKKNIDLEAEVREDLPPLHQDQARVQQILNNLLSNAIKFTPEGGRITVNAGSDGGDYLLLRVSDTGVGIADEDQQTIFEKFRQGRTGVPSGDAMTREYSGTGLGLSIVKELCKLLGGEIAVESELGQGSTFTARLPWRLQEQPRLDSALVEEFEEFTKPRFDIPHGSAGQDTEPAPQAAE